MPRRRVIVLASAAAILAVAVPLSLGGSSTTGSPSAHRPSAVASSPSIIETDGVPVQNQTDTSFLTGPESVTGSSHGLVTGMRVTTFGTFTDSGTTHFAGLNRPGRLTINLGRGSLVLQHPGMSIKSQFAGCELTRSGVTSFKVLRGTGDYANSTGGSGQIRYWTYANQANHAGHCSRRVKPTRGNSGTVLKIVGTFTVQTGRVVWSNGVTASN